MIDSDQLMGLIPAAGSANRISPLPCSKEILPVGFSGDNDARPKLRVACHYLLDNIRRAGTQKACIVLRKGKWDIPGYFEDGGLADMNLCYCLTREKGGVPFTLDTAYKFVHDKTVLFGFPDILIKPRTAYIDLLQQLNKERADLVLGLFNAHQTSKVDMVALGESGRIRHVDIKPRRTPLKYTWMMAVWTPLFSRFLNRFVKALSSKDSAHGLSDDFADGKEVYFGDVINAAIKKKLKVEKVIFRDGDYLDIGTLEDLRRATEFTNNTV